MREEEVILILLSMMIMAGVAVLWIAMSNRRAVREMEHRERLAMIQHGAVPSPEGDPLAFEAHMDSLQSSLTRQERWRSAGTLTIGVGVAMAVLLTFVGELNVGFGVGGAFAVLGAALWLNGLQVGRTPAAPRPPIRRPMPPPDSSSL